MCWFFHAYVKKIHGSRRKIPSKRCRPYIDISRLRFMVMSREGNAGRGHSVKIDNSAIERVEELKYLGVTLTDQNSIQEEIKSRLKLGNACYHSEQNLLSSRLLSKNLKIKIRVYRTIIL